MRWCVPTRCCCQQSSLLVSCVRTSGVSFLGIRPAAQTTGGATLLCPLLFLVRRAEDEITHAARLGIELALPLELGLPRGAQVVAHRLFGLVGRLDVVGQPTEADRFHALAWFRIAARFIEVSTGLTLGFPDAAQRRQCRCALVAVGQLCVLLLLAHVRAPSPMQLVRGIDVKPYLAWTLTGERLLRTTGTSGYDHAASSNRRLTSSQFTMFQKAST